jgi:uncharacterized protein (TIGR04255 family)
MEMMARRREHLGKAPIAEAIIDFRVSRREQVSPDIFSNLEEFIGQQYANKSQIRMFQGFFGVNDGRLLDPKQSQADLGWRYQTEHEVAQFRIDGFTFSKLEPYTTWEEVSTEAFRLWAIYRRLAEPAQVLRLAVRYINRMRITGMADVAEYLEVAPTLPPPIPQRLREFLTRVYVEDDETGASAIIVQALEPPVDPNAESILLDIDAFRQVKLSPDDPLMPEIFGQLRTLKNAIFYASITEKTAEIYE